MEVIPFNNILKIIIGSLNRIDNNLIGHGERVAYALLRLMEREKCFSRDEIGKISLIVLMHDIGGWEKKNISDLLRIENEERFSHAQYGYIFMKHFTPFPQYAPIVLYHHSSCEIIDRFVRDEALRKVIKQLRVADIADLIMLSDSDITNEELSKRLYGMCGNGELDKSAVTDYADIILKDDISHVPKECKKTRESFFKRMENVSVSQDEQEQLLQTIVSAIDFRSRYTVYHCATMIRISELLSDYCGVAQKDKKTLHYGALFHDLGKIAIPTYILEARGKLDGEEWEIMKSHVVITGEILKGNVSNEILQIAVRHHEAMNGSGYPQGLCGEQLSLMQRIVIVADVISALAGRRSYKEPFSLRKIKQILREMKDEGKLCPYVTGIALEYCQEIYDEANRVGSIQQKLYQDIQREYENMCQSINGSAG